MSNQEVSESDLSVSGLSTGEGVLVQWPKCQIKDCDNDVDAFIYQAGTDPLGFCHTHYYPQFMPTWEPEKLNGIIRWWRKYFGWSGPKHAQ